VKNHSLRDFIETILIATVGGAAFSLLGMPAGWLSGSMFSCAVAAIAGRRLYVPTWLARVCYVALGVTAGSAATPSMLSEMAHWPGSLALVLVALVTITATAGLYLQKVHRWPLKTALLAAVPGGIAQVLVLAAEQKADMRAIALVQSTRLLLLALALPFLLNITGLLHQPVAPVAAPASAEWLQLVVLFAAAGAAAYVLWRVGFGGALFFGPMLVSGTLHAVGFVHAGLPRPLLNAAVVLVGSVSGSRFSNTSLATMVEFLTAAFGSFAVTVTVGGLFTAMVALLFPLPVADIALAYSPGAADVMMLLALALQLDPVFVGAHHITRMLFVPVLLPVLGRYIAKMEGEESPD
jgi:membrane AbrB-like protein